jgi:7-carboxy-7-deazaguanine synthase
MSYAVKEIFHTLQGEREQAGRQAVFCRFSGCNLWSGREKDRLNAVCQFCDTDFVGTDGTGGGRFEGASPLADAVAAAWPGGGVPSSSVPMANHCYSRTTLSLLPHNRRNHRPVSGW